MNPKKLGLGGLGIVVALAIYYFTVSYLQATKQTEQTTKLKHQMNLQLTEIQTSGFSISDRVVQKEEEHFIVSLDDPKKAIGFFAQKGIRVDIEEAEELKGLKLGVDVMYLSDTVALELYPVVLPTNLTMLLTKENNKEVLTQIDEMIKKKTFFTHIDMDHSATTFKGYIKDIHETIKGENEIQVTLQGYQFSGVMKDERVIQFRQTLNLSHFYISDVIDRYMSGLKSSYKLTGATAYDYISDYSIEKIKIGEAPESILIVNDISFHSTSRVENGLARETLKANIKNIDLMFDKDRVGMQTLFLDMNVSNIDVAAREKLQKTNPNKEKEFDAQLGPLVSKNIHVDIPMLSVGNVILDGKEMSGFSLNATMDLDRSLDIYRLGINPKHTLDKMEGNIHLSISKELLELIKEDPKAMLTYMMYRPKRVLGQRVYNIEIGNGLIKINGKPLEL